MTTRPVHCCACDRAVDARLTDGREIYPRHPDLAGRSFWKCDGCGNYVGCHRGASGSPRPLGNIPTKEIRHARQCIHAILDPIWKDGRMGRKALYAVISERIGREYHTAEIRTVEDAREVYRIVREIANA